jgi:GNAT superfamily N-acetyltransferase
MKRNTYKHNNYWISPVEDFTIFRGFSCLTPEDGDRDLDDFIHHDAQRHNADRIAVTYQFTYKECTADRKRISHLIGFATLQNDAITFDPADETVQALGYPYKSYPAVKIGRMGIQRQLQRKYLGTLLIFMLKQFFLQANRTGCRFLTVDARVDEANNVNVIPFYEKNGFHPFITDDERAYKAMYFDLKSGIFLPVEYRP